jgi:hypothetical protein
MVIEFVLNSNYPSLTSANNTTNNSPLTASTSRKSSNLASFNSIYASQKAAGLNQSHKRTNSHTLNPHHATPAHLSSAADTAAGCHGNQHAAAYFGSNSDLHRTGGHAPPRAHHAHHHSISNPIHSSSSTAALIDLSISPPAKSPDKDLDKIV